MRARTGALKRIVFPSPRGEGGPRRALSPAGAGRVRGHFLAFSATIPIVPTTFRTNEPSPYATCSLPPAVPLQPLRVDILLDLLVL